MTRTLKSLSKLKMANIFINGKPAEKFDDQGIIIERRMEDGDDLEVPELTYTPSPFREREYGMRTGRIREQSWMHSAMIWKRNGKC